MNSITQKIVQIFFFLSECEPTYKNPEEAPTVKLTQDEIKKLFSANNKNTPLKCIKHFKDIKFFCEAYTAEFCEDCKKADKEQENSHAYINEIKKDSAEKLSLNQCLNLEQIKIKINENKNKNRLRN